MFENTIIKECLPETVFTGDLFLHLKSQFINIISENKLTISETRYLFNCILDQFETNMPVINNTK